MKIAVCIKQVVTREWPLRVNEAGTWIRDNDASFELNEPDAYALEEALRLKEKHGGEVVVCCAGPARASQVIREALARGADRAIHVELDGADPRGLRCGGGRGACWPRPSRDEQFELVLTGLQSDDHGFGQVGVLLAAALGMPHATIIMEVQAGDGGLRVKRELEGGWFQWIALPLPGAADDPERDQSASLRDAQGHHGREEEGDPQGGAGGRPGRGRSGSCASTLPEKAKETQMISGIAGRGRERRSSAAFATMRE